MNDIVEHLLCLLFPNRCRFCDELTDAGNDICDECMDKIPFIEGEICYRCGAEKQDCTCKGKHGKFYEKSVSAMYYTDFVKRCIFDFKFHGNRSTYKCLAKMMTKCCDERYPNIKFDYVTYVPMRKKKEHMRGFNQSKLIAKEISRETKIPFGNNLLLKIYDTDNQHDCKGLERTGNLLGAFDINSEYDVSGKTILLIDDIKTSGATLSECSKILLLYGAEHIFCLTAALRNSKIKGQEIIEKGGGENARREDSF